MHVKGRKLNTIIAFDVGERKPNFGVLFSIAGVLCTVIGRQLTKNLKQRSQQSSDDDFVELLEMQEAGSYYELSSTMVKFHAPTQNILVYAGDRWRESTI